MARDRVWWTHLAALNNQPTPRAIPLLDPSVAVAGATVIRVVGSALYTIDLVDPQDVVGALYFGIFVGPAATGAELLPPAVNTTEWLYSAVDAMLPPNDSNPSVFSTTAIGLRASIESSGNRVLAAGENVWLVCRPRGVAAAAFVNVHEFIRVLTLAPV